MRSTPRVGVLLFCLAGAILGSTRPVVGQASSAAERRAVDRAGRSRSAGRPEEAALILTDYLDAVPAATEALRLLAEVSIEMGDVSNLVSYSEAAVQAAPEVSELRGLWVEALLRASFLDSARHVAERWADAEHANPGARLALADVHLASQDPAAAIDALRSSTVEPDPELLSRLADLLRATDQPDALRSVWVELLTLDPPRVADVVEDLRAAGPRQVDFLTRLGEGLSEGSGGATSAGAVVALRLGHAELARGMAGQARSADDLQAAAFLREYVREANEADLPDEVAWAALQLVQLSPRPADRLRWQAMAADQALAAGDTSAARDAFVDLRRDSEPGAGPYGLASRRLFSLLAADPGSLQEAGELLGRYARLYPDSGHVEAAMRGELAIGYARADQIEGGEAVLTAGRQKLSASSLGGVEAAAARLSLYAGSRDSTAARARRSLGEENLEAAERTRRLRLLTFAQTADSSEVAIVGEATHGLLMSPSEFDPSGSVRSLAGLPGTAGRATALAFLAEEADAAGRSEVAVGLRRQVVEAYPRSPEAPTALLALARTSTGSDSAVWLERLIVGYPESALAPLARRMLTQLQREGA